MLPRPFLISVNLRAIIAYPRGVPLRNLRLGRTDNHNSLRPITWTLRQFSACRVLQIQHNPQLPPKEHPKSKHSVRENIYTLPNLLTVSRILACPVLGWSVLNNDFYLATGLLAYAGASDLVRFSVVNSLWGWF
jgi:hypothetical protein